MYVRHALIALFMLVPATALAQNSESPQQQGPPMSIEDLMRVQVEPVFGASKRLQPVTEAPGVRDDRYRGRHSRYGFRTLRGHPPQRARVLRHVRSQLQLHRRAWLRAAGRLQHARPDSGGRPPDERRLYEQATPGPELGLDPGNFARVEVIRGPASSLYGTSAFFAVVNIVTKTATRSRARWANRRRVARNARGPFRGRTETRERRRLSPVRHLLQHRRREAPVPPRIRFAGHELRRRLAARR